MISFALQLKAGHLNDLAGPWATRRATSATRAIRGAVWGAWRARRRPVDSDDRRAGPRGDRLDFLAGRFDRSVDRLARSAGRAAPVGHLGRLAGQGGHLGRSAGGFENLAVHLAHSAGHLNVLARPSADCLDYSADCLGDAAGRSAWAAGHSGPRRAFRATCRATGATSAVRRATWATWRSTWATWPTV